MVSCNHWLITMFPENKMRFFGRSIPIFFRYLMDIEALRVYLVLSYPTWIFNIAIFQRPFVRNMMINPYHGDVRGFLSSQTLKNHQVGYPTWLFNISPWYRWPIEIDGLPGFTYEKWVDFPWLSGPSTHHGDPGDPGA